MIDKRVHSMDDAVMIKVDMRTRRRWLNTLYMMSFGKDQCLVCEMLNVKSEGLITGHAI